jgi:hypothetical protein
MHQFRIPVHQMNLSDGSTALRGSNRDASEPDRDCQVDSVHPMIQCRLVFAESGWTSSHWFIG